MERRKYIVLFPCSIGHLFVCHLVRVLTIKDLFLWTLSLVAAKTFYFGVGGDILSFRRLIEQDGVFNVKVVFSAQAFVRREILELTFKA